MSFSKASSKERREFVVGQIKREDQGTDQDDHSCWEHEPGGKQWSRRCHRVIYEEPNQSARISFMMLAVFNLLLTPSKLMEPGPVPADTNGGMNKCWDLQSLNCYMEWAAQVPHIREREDFVTIILLPLQINNDLQPKKEKYIFYPSKALLM